MAYNASQTKSPVVYNLMDSQFEVVKRGYVFRFSTQRHAEKFGQSADYKVEWMNDSMTRRFHIPCRFDELALFQLYMQIEGRGFLVYDEPEQVWYHSPEEVKFFTATTWAVS